ncbi:GIY-YIG nuclease family protein [Streptomyces sp. NPDC058686]|uniref:GIY-YIG nuclease family protein n=1 Tax=Streptomyces sp. NPDC058686 TaxID=3346599 RepID=UPI003660C5F1
MTNENTTQCAVIGCNEQGKTTEFNGVKGAPALTMCAEHSWDFFWAYREKGRKLAAAIHEANPDMNHTPGYVYVIRLANSNVKLGYTTDPSLKRIKTLSGKPNQGTPVQVLAVLKGGESLEAVIHNRWAHLRIQGAMEEFWADPSLLQWAEQQGIDPEVDDLESWLINKHGRGSKSEYAQEMFGDVAEKAQEIRQAEADDFWQS